MKSFLQMMIACVLIIHAHAADGWEKVKWGMTMEQVREIYPMAIRPEERPDKGDMRQFEGEMFRGPKTMVMEGYEWQGVKFKVALLFSEGKRLAACLLITPTKEPDTHVNLTPEYERLVKVLTATFGESQEEGVPETLIRKRKWKNGETEVRCTLFLSKDPIRSVISLNYLKPGAFNLTQ